MYKGICHSFIRANNRTAIRTFQDHFFKKMDSELQQNVIGSYKSKRVLKKRVLSNFVFL